MRSWHRVDNCIAIHVNGERGGSWDRWTGNRPSIDPPSVSLASAPSGGNLKPAERSLKPPDERMQLDWCRGEAMPDCQHGQTRCAWPCLHPSSPCGEPPVQAISLANPCNYFRSNP